MPRKTAVPDVPKIDPDDGGEVTPKSIDRAEFGLDDIPEEELGFPPRDVIDAEYAEEAAKEEEKVPERSLTVVRPGASDHHLMVGMATLANMSEDDFNAKVAVLKKGRERIEMIQRDLMTEGVDYGKVKGIEKPFLHQPGAEFLANLYGLAIRQEVERVTRQVGDDPAVPPYAYHVRTYIHLGDTDGPVVTTAFGEANPYEEKYRYRWAQRACPQCGRTDALITRKNPPAMAGKVHCINFGGKPGCGSVFEPTDQRLAPSEKVENPDLFGLAETILQMASKRSMVAAVRRATGTSGLFTQDDDSPSVRQQSESAAPEGDGDAPPPVVESAPMEARSPVPGGVPTQVQMDRLRVLAKEKGLKGRDIAELVNRLFGDQVELNAAAAQAAVQKLTADALGTLLAFIETGDLDSLSSRTDVTK